MIEPSFLFFLVLARRVSTIVALFLNDSATLADELSQHQLLEQTPRAKKERVPKNE